MSQNDFASRHIGISEQDQAVMLAKIGVKSLDELIDKTLPEDIRLPELPDLPEALTEGQFARRIDELAAMNRCYRSYIGQGWYGSHTPAVIQRNILENPVWYTSYTPYQAEISQGRLEALFVFQTMVCELTGLNLANCSLLDEATAAAEAAMMMFNLRSRAQEKDGVCRLFVDRAVFPQTKAVLRTRCSEQGIVICEGDYAAFQPSTGYFGAIVQYPDANGNIEDYRDFCEQAHAAGMKVAVATDLMALVLLNTPGSWGADIAFGSAQRFGLPMGYGGPTAAFFAAKDEYKRFLPGRIIGLSKDSHEKPAYRLALQSREQHIKREKATSNICTASALMADMAALYAVWHGPQGLRDIAAAIHGKASYLADALEVYGYTQENNAFFDTLKIGLPEGLTTARLKKVTESYGLNLHYFADGKVGISLDETTDEAALETLIEALAAAVDNAPVPVGEEDWNNICSLDDSCLRQDRFMSQPVFHSYHSETDMMRYIKRLENKDISLTHSMIPLGSCTMKLNAAAEMLPLSRPEFASLHPLAPKSQAKGYLTMIEEVSRMLCSLTGFQACCLQPNSGAAGEYAGLRVIREYFKAQGQEQRRLIMIPDSAHGTNPASAHQAGFDIVHVCCDSQGNIDVGDWEAKARDNADRLAGCMITYPSTHGIFEPQIKRLCRIVHENGGLVYMDGANMNAQVGLTSPGHIGADICHLNLHKTFAMPHGGGGPGMGPICCNDRLAPYMPVYAPDQAKGITVATAPYGNVMLLPITYGYLLMMGAEGLRRATEAAILSANYMAACLKDLYGIYYTGARGYVGHELILDCHGFKETGIDDGDIAKRLMDFGFHAPTLSFPVHGTLMIEPTESESLAEIDRFVEAMKAIREEIQAVAQGRSDAQDNPLKNAPHPQYELSADDWTHPYPRSQAAYPLDWVRDNKFMIPVGRVDNAYGDRNLVATMAEN
ncbi:MAG: aminomethyl-transferring glycine dehydrogenase [Bacteroidales bacterium]|nr:aminomethyl-transferring glycine dehydrogenase [Bacteroidales bacterium]